MTAEARRELDLERDGVLRAVLVAHGPGHHTLLLVVHHLAVDGESTGILLADLLAAYVHGEVPGPAPEAGFDAYAADRAAEAAAATGTAEAYWRERLDGADLTVDFPLDVPGGDGGDGAPREAAVPWNWTPAPGTGSAPSPAPTAPAPPPSCSPPTSRP